MKTMKIWRKSRLSESHANMFANGRTGAIYVIALAMLAVLSLSSCDKQDGDWDSMVWKAEVPMVIDDGVYDVSDRGGTFTFTCRNYSKPWIEGAVSGEEHYFPDREKNDYHTIMADWFKAEIVGNKLTVFFEPNKESREHILSLTVTAGDIFHTFTFKQFAHQK